MKFLSRVSSILATSAIEKPFQVRNHSAFRLQRCYCYDSSQDSCTYGYSARGGSVDFLVSPVIFSFPVNYCFSVIFFSTPPRVCQNKKTPSHFHRQNYPLTRTPREYSI